uniref:G protein-regulated inducer of neurite outgrowth 2 n=1 Tax=Semicossyphus pulcher TaxID=241346 RepID=UPI0037E95CBA
MAEAGRPVLELLPLGGEVSLDSTLSPQPLFDPSKSSLQAPSRIAGEPSNTCQEGPKEAISMICEEKSAGPPHRETKRSGLKVSRELSEQDQSPSEHCVPSGASSRHCSVAKTHTASHHHNIVVNAINDTPQAGRTVQNIKPASLPVYRSHSDTLPITQGVHPSAPDNEACGLAYHARGNSIQEADVRCMLSCKQPMELQQCNIITTFSRGVTSGEGPVHHPQSKCLCISSPQTAAKLEGVKEKGQLPTKCDKAHCCGSYINHANYEDTFAAYCHPQPIPAPSQLLPRLTHAEPICDIQHAVEPPSAINHLNLPRLISSVSETGLDAKHLLRCCNLNCSWASTLPPGAGPQSLKTFGLEECCSGSIGLFRTTTRDMGTMTAHKELRDVGVQTGQTVTPHVFPEICLAEESRSETSCSQTPNPDSNGDKKAGGAPKSPVKEVKWDAEGMTWEVYGASVDPEELGLAIQKHLELQIKETANHAAKLSRQDTNTSRQSGNNRCQRKRSRMMGSFRTPACCVRTTTAVD